jgi:hypothetical protein
MAGCFECTARAVASHLQGQHDWYAFSDTGVSGKPQSCVRIRKIHEAALEDQSTCLWFADIAACLQGPWQQGHCHTLMGTGLGSISPPVVTPTMLSDYGTPSLSPTLSPEEMLVNPLSSLGLDHESLAEFGSDLVPYPQKEESQTNQNEKTECASTVRRMRRREQNRDSYVPLGTQLNPQCRAKCVRQTTPISGPERVVYKAT